MKVLVQEPGKQLQSVESNHSCHSSAGSGKPCLYTFLFSHYQ